MSHIEFDIRAERKEFRVHYNGVPDSVAFAQRHFAEERIALLRTDAESGFAGGVICNAFRQAIGGAV